MRKSFCVLIVAALVATSGCKDRPSAQPEKPDIEGGLRKTFPVLDRTIALYELDAIGKAYRIMEVERRTPKTVEELEPYYENRKITQAIKDGALVVIWGVDPETQPKEAILAYTQEPDAQGERVVLLCNLSTPQVMGTQAFEAAPKAKSR
jgi:hypothetical protein